MEGIILGFFVFFVVVVDSYEMNVSQIYQNVNYTLRSKKKDVVLPFRCQKHGSVSRKTFSFVSPSLGRYFSVLNASIFVSL